MRCWFCQSLAVWLAGWLLQPASLVGLASLNVLRAIARVCVSHRLRRHIDAVHLLHRPHHCKSCPARFAAASDLRAHVDQVHLKRKPFGCDMCGSRFGRRSHLKSHRAKIHGTKD
jgi:uncharacterized Zn-finger protein